MSDRKAELERKKEKLRLIREEKERRRREREIHDKKVAVTNLTQPLAENGQTTDLNIKLKEMGINPVDDILSSFSSMKENLPTSSPSVTNGYFEGKETDRLNSNEPNLIKDATTKSKLSLAPINQININPIVSSETYAKQTQTTELSSELMTVSTTSKRGMVGGTSTNAKNDSHDYYMFAFDDPEEMYEEDSLPGLGSSASASPTNLSHPSHHRQSQKLPPGYFQSGMPNVKEVTPAITQQDVEEAKQMVDFVVAKEEKEKTKQTTCHISLLTDKEKKAITCSEDFTFFFDRASRLVERALSEDISQLFIDYSSISGEKYKSSRGVGGGSVEEFFYDEDEENAYRRIETHTDCISMPSLTYNKQFYDDRWSKHRVVTSLEWSSYFPELMLASYDKNCTSSADPDGICLVWNTRFKKCTPEYIFHCESQVMSSCFASFHPNFIIGGTFSGQIVLWDNRVARRTPVQRSPLSASAHTHPVYCVQVVGSENAHNLISVSTDGRVCTWSMDMLSQPLEMMELHQPKQNRPVAVTSLAFPIGDVNNFIVGSEEGTVYTACRHGNTSGITETFQGHEAPITGLSAHPSPIQMNSTTTGTTSGGGGDVPFISSTEFGHLFLTSSMDWSIKLWSLRKFDTDNDNTDGTRQLHFNNQDKQLLHSFECNNDYVYDVAWSPVHPSIFASIDGSGRLDIWNIATDLEGPVASIVTDGAPALNRVSWTQSGLHVTVGDNDGRIWVYDVSDTLAIPQHLQTNSSSDSWTKMALTLQDMQQQFSSSGGGSGVSSSAVSMSSGKLESGGSVSSHQQRMSIGGPLPLSIGGAVSNYGPLSNIQQHHSGPSSLGSINSQGQGKSTVNFSRS